MQAGKLVAKSAVKAWLGPIGWAWTAYDIVSTGLEVKEIYDKLNKLQEDIDKIKETANKIKDLVNKDDLKPSDMADAQALVAAANPCLRARKCMLVPFKQSEQAGLNNKDSGCCKGQTAHHVIPKGQFKSKPEKNAPARKSCKGYDADKAPCVCTEGTSHSRGGTHQKIHDNLEPSIEAGADTNGELSYDKSRDMAVASLRKSAPSCDPECLKAQLDKYHKKACKQSGDNFKLRAASAKSGKTYTKKPGGLG